MRQTKSFISLFQDELLIQMKHRSRLLSIAVAPILFSSIARSFFRNDTTLRTNMSLSLVRSSRFDRGKNMKSFIYFHLVTVFAKR